MEFEWDEDKRERNSVKHRIDFVDAVTIWDGQVIDPYVERTVGREARMSAGHDDG